MEAERQQEQSRLFFNPCAYPYLLTHTRLLYDHYYIPYVTSARDIAKWRQSRFLPNYPTPSGVYWVHGFVGPDGYWRRYGRKLNRVPGIEDPSEISDIGWERMLSRIPGVVIR